MRSIPTITGQRIAALLRHRWTPFAGAFVVVLALAAAFVQPWPHATKPAMKTTATEATAPTIQATPTSSAAPAAPAAATPAAPAAPAAPATPAAPVVPATVSVNSTSKALVPGKVPQLPWPTTGQSAIAIGKTVIGISGPQGKAPTASMAKAMTAYLVLSDHPLSGNADGPSITVTPAEAAVLSSNIREGQSVLTVRAGEVLTERQALNALMLKSANNVARILARWDAGSIDAFVAKMNGMAGKLGMSSTHYTDPSGFAPTTVSTTTDQIMLATTAMQRSDFAKIVDTKYAYEPIEGRIANVNPLLGQDGIVGIKTGSMGSAGGCLVFAAKHTINGANVWITGTVMGQRSSAIGDLHQAFVSSDNLVKAVHKILGTHTVIKAGQVVGTVPGTTKHLVAAKDLSVVGYTGMAYHQTVTATVPTAAAAGTQVGTVTVDGGLTASVPVLVQ